MAGRRMRVGRMLAVSMALALALVVPTAAHAEHGHAGEGANSHPVHIHTGVCPVPGVIVGPMPDVSPVPGAALGAPGAVPVETARSKVDLSMLQLVGADHAIVVHLSHDAMATLIACGDIGGPMDASGVLIIGLAPVGESGSSGIAMLSDGGAGTTTVEVYLAHWGTSAPAASPSPQPYRY